MSAIALSLGYLRRRPLPYLGYSSYSRDFTGNCAVLSILESRSFKLIFGLDLSNSNCKYSLTTIDQKI